MPNPDNTRIAKNTAFLYLRMLVVLFLSLYTTRIIFNILGIVDYGIFNVVCGLVSMSAFLNNSMANGTQRYYNFKLGEGKNKEIPLVFSSSLLIQIVLAILLVVVLESVGLWYLHVQMVIPTDRIYAANWVFQCSVLALIFVVLQVPYSAAILAFEKMDYYAIVSIIEAFLKLLIAIILPYFKSDHLIIYGFFTLLLSGCVFLLYVSYCRIKFFSLTTFKIQIIDRRFLREMISFSGWNIFGTFAYMIKDQGLNVLLNTFFGPVVNAARGIAMQINNALQGFSSNIVAAMRPQLVQSYSSNNITRVQKMFFSQSRLIFLMLFVLSLPIYIELPYILKLWIGSSYPEYTVTFSRLIIINTIITSMNTPISQVVHATGKMKHYQIGTSIVICTILPIAYIFLRMNYSPISTFVITILISIVNQAICLVLLKKVFSYSILYYFRKVVIPCILLIFFAPIIPYLISNQFNEGFIRFSFVTIVCIILSVAIGYFLVLSREERQFILNYIKKSQNKLMS